ncbi:hypothetical protein ACRAWB_01880 [Leifsonia poae]|uniref:hypothetical protein n=1 Tax=Leifsonia poae TaxID=110933 RepID=UPI003D68E84C
MAKVEKVTEDDVTAAREALEVAQRELERLREAYFASDGTSWDAVESQEAVLRYAEAEIIRLRRAKERHDQEVRFGELAKLRKEIDSYSLASGDEFSKLLDIAESAAVSFAEAFKARNEKISGWQDRLRQLGVAEISPTKLVPSDADAGLGLGPLGADFELQAGNRKLKRVYPGAYLTGLLVGLGAERRDSRYYFDEKGYGYSDIERLRAEVGSVDHEAAGIPDDAVFFRTADGGLIVTDQSNAFSPEIVKRDRLERISREEALNG